jgi:hypothetical protein
MAAIILVMRTQKPQASIRQSFQAVFEMGVLRPITPLRPKEQSRVTDNFCGESKWRKEFDRLMRKMSRRTRTTAQKKIETRIRAKD